MNVEELYYYCQGLLHHTSDGAQAPFENLGGKEISKFGGDREKKLIQIKQYFDAWNTKPIFAYYVDSEGV